MAATARSALPNTEPATFLAVVIADDDLSW
jgi:hypothetical protein